MRVSVARLVLFSYFQLPATQARFNTMDSGSLVRGSGIPDFNRKRDSRFLELDYGFQSPGSRMTLINTRGVIN